MTDTANQERLTRLLGYHAQDPQNISLLSDIAAHQLKLGQHAEARRSAEKIIALAGERPEGHVLLGLAAAGAEDYATAAAALGHALQLGDDSPAALYYHAHSLSMLGRFADARESAERAAQFAEQYPYAPALYVRVLHYLGELETAIAYAESLRARGVVAPRVNGMLSTLYMDVGNFEKARASSQGAIGEDADDTDAQTTAGLLALGDLNAEHAIAGFHRVLRAQPRNGRAMLGMGLGHMLAGDLNTAIETIEQALRDTNMREHMGTWQTLAWCQILRRDLDGAERAIREAMELDHSFADNHGTLAVIQMLRGEVDAANLSIRRATGLDPDNLPVKLALSLVQSRLGNAVQAQELFDRIMVETTLPDGRTAQQAVAEMLVRNETGMSGTVH
jgi:tetratricopeptide (TPR) repeat protein